MGPPPSIARVRGARRRPRDPLSKDRVFARTLLHPPRARARVGFPASGARGFRGFLISRFRCNSVPPLTFESFHLLFRHQKAKKQARVDQGHGSQFLRNQRYYEKGSKLAAAKA